jgi:hypothetical protein
MRFLYQHTTGYGGLIDLRLFPAKVANDKSSRLSYNAIHATPNNQNNQKTDHPRG